LSQDGGILSIMKDLGLQIRRSHCEATWRQARRHALSTPIEGFCSNIRRTFEPRWGYLVYHEGPGLADPAEPLRSNSATSPTTRVQHTYRPCPAGFQERQSDRESAAHAPLTPGACARLREQGDQRASRAREEKIFSARALSLSALLVLLALKK